MTNNRKAKGVRVIDAETKEEMEFYAKIVFVNAGALNSLLLLLNSTSSRFPNGFGNDNGMLGHYMMFHNYRGQVGASFDGYDDQYYFGRRPAGVYMPRFRNVGSDKQQAFSARICFCGWRIARIRKSRDVIGASLKEAMSKPGEWHFWMTGMGECLPHPDNKVTLDKSKIDAWGIPQLAVDCDYRENELAMLKDILSSGAEMLEKAGFKNIYTNDTKQAPGLDIHEMVAHGWERIRKRQYSTDIIRYGVQRMFLLPMEHDDVQRLSKPIAYIHGFDCACR